MFWCVFKYDVHQVSREKEKKIWSLSLVFMLGKAFGYGLYPTKHLLVH
jgi:hypothetical protein